MPTSEPLPDAVPDQLEEPAVGRAHDRGRRDHQIVIIGAGPAGLTAAYELAKAGVTSTVVEADDVVGWRFDIGGHRFFTKVPEVEALWHEILPDEDFLVRPRMSRIYYNNKFFDYPLRAMNALKGLGFVEAVRCVGSYIWVRIRKPEDTSTFEGWTASRFGWRLYRIFFKTYTEKVWGVPATAIQADWAAQRIKNLSLGKAIVHSLLPRRKQTEITSLIEEFQYPKYGPGMMWEACRDKVVAAGSEVRMSTAVVRLEHADGRVHTVEVEGPQGRERLPATDVISSMPLSALVKAMDPPPPAEVLAAADGLRYRDFLTVALVVPERYAFPDNWIYVHAPEVKLGRIQNFGSWSPYMVKDGRTCLGLEYFVNEGDEWWAMDDDELVARGTEELQRLGLVDPGVVEAGYVVRMPKAYPVYDATYAANVETMRAWLEANAANVHAVGRNGMHKYNNQDHSMYTAMLTVENILKDAHHDIWSVNVEQEYHEEKAEGGTGRAAPVIG
jgi:protoporphyrinogen oxidase